MSGRIQLKDLVGKSYMKMGFYKRIELVSTKMRIIELRDTEIENNIWTKNEAPIDAEF